MVCPTLGSRTAKEQNRTVVMLTVAEEKDETDEHEERMIVELHCGVISVPLVAVSVDAHPHAHHDRRRHQHHLNVNNTLLQ